MSRQPTLKVILCFLVLFLGTTANAAVYRSIDGEQTEWMEISATVGLSRLQVESMLADPNSNLYGYRYATRAETESLFASYTTLPSYLNVYYNYPAAAGQQMQSDFGITFTEYHETRTMTTFDGVTVDYNMDISSYFMHGGTDECGAGMSCIGRIYTAALDDVVQAWDFVGRRGADQYDTNPDLFMNTDSNNILGSLLISVPAPAAFWLILTGLLGLFSVEYRKKKNLS